LITRDFLEGAEGAGATSEVVFLVEKKIFFCRGCFSCWVATPGKCVIDDDVATILEKMIAADVIVAATPVYVDNVTGIMKAFMDRMIPLADPHFDKDAGGECVHASRHPDMPRKKIVVLSNSGFPEQSHFQVLRLLFRRIARNMRADIVGEIYRGGGELLSTKNVIVTALAMPYKRLLRRAGEELVTEGRISEGTQAMLEKPIVSDDRYIAGANQYWDSMLEKKINR
jgi:multimeric flavodoxin WrbA